MIKKRSLVFALLMLACTQAILSQTITISGSIYGLMSEKVLLMRKASKNVSFEGGLSGVKITMSGVSNDITTETDITGSYSITLNSTGVYNMNIEKAGYSKLQVTFNYSDDGMKTYYPAVSFMLKKDDNTLNPLGEIDITNGGKFNYIAAKSNNKSSTGVPQSNQILLEKAGLINNSSSGNVINLKPVFIPRAIAAAVAKAPVIEKTDTIIPKEDLLAAPVLAMLADTATSVNNLRDNIEKSKQLLATLRPEDKGYALLEAQIRNAEMLLKQKESVIQLQDAQITETKKKVMFLGLFSAFAVLSALLLLLFLYQRKKHLVILDEKNKVITKSNNKILSSIKYAATIQFNFFKEKAALNKLFGKTFIFNSPKDMLSGDFYWFTKKGDQKILVVADCTGHGVPGALLTMLGHSLLDDIVSVKGETSPGKILLALSEGVTAAFARHDELDYGMDITVLSMQEGSDEVTFSGITNGLYHCRKGEIKHLAVTPKSIGPDIEHADVKDQTMKVQKGDCFFMMSDGFQDQFNENMEKPEKFNVARLEELLKKISIDDNFSSSDKVLKSEIDNWRGAREQIDDVLIVGVKME